MFNRHLIVFFKAYLRPRQDDLYINIKVECKQPENGLIYLHEFQKHWNPPELYATSCNRNFHGWEGDLILFICILAFFFFTKLKLTTEMFKLKFPFILFTAVKKNFIFLCSIYLTIPQKKKTVEKTSIHAILKVGCGLAHL